MASSYYRGPRLRSGLMAQIIHRHESSCRGQTCHGKRSHTSVSRSDRFTFFLMSTASAAQWHVAHNFPAGFNGQPAYWGFPFAMQAPIPGGTLRVISVNSKSAQILHDGLGNIIPYGAGLTLYVSVSGGGWTFQQFGGSQMRPGACGPPSGTRIQAVDVVPQQLADVRSTMGGDSNGRITCRNRG